MVRLDFADLLTLVDALTYLPSIGLAPDIADRVPVLKEILLDELRESSIDDRWMLEIT